MTDRIMRAVSALAAGQPILVADSMDRENEVDAIIAAERATPQVVGWMVRHTSGYLCAPMTQARADALELPLMVVNNQDPKRTAYTVACDAAEGITTGISAADRARTLRVLANQQSRPNDLIRPGHILPLRARPGGVRERAGHTEAAVELCQLAGIEPVAAIGEMVLDDGSMMRVHQAQPFAAEHGLVLITIEELIAFLNAKESGNSVPVTAANSATVSAGRVSRVAEALLPTQFGEFKVVAYRDQVTSVTHLAIVAGDLAGGEPVLARIHSECLTGEALGSLRCDCGPQLEMALRAINESGGVVIYLRGHEGRGIGLGEKIRAYNLQDQGLDTAEANERLGWPVDVRNYGAAEAIFVELGIRRVHLLTNNPDKTHLDPTLVEVTSVVPIEVGFDPHNVDYLRTKAQLGHTFKTLENYANSL